MRVSALALDYDGTIAVNGAFDAGVRDAIADARRRGIAAVLVTGRRLAELRQAAGDLTCFDAVVGENGAVIEFPVYGRRIVLASAPASSVLVELGRRGVPYVAGECVVEMDAHFAPAALDVIQALEQPLILAFNRGRLMVLPQSIGKSTGLRHALHALRISVHNTIGIGDAENDHDLLNACEVGAAVSWGSAALRAAADEIVEGAGPPAVEEYIRRVSRLPRLPAPRSGRRRLVLGCDNANEEVSLAVRGRPILIAGEPGTGKSWLAGLICEQAILQGYCLSIIDPEGDYQALEALPGVIVLGGDDPPPRAREVTRAIRNPEMTIVVDLSKMPHGEKREYVRRLLPMLATLRRHAGLPHKIVLDEAHYFLGGASPDDLLEPELNDYVFVTYRISMLPPAIRQAADVVVIVTRETDTIEAKTLATMCRPCTSTSPDMFRDLSTMEAALLPGTDEAGGRFRRFQLAPRLTSHVRHRSKYLDMPVLDTEAFVFTDDGRPSARAHTLKELIGLLAATPADRLSGHLRRHDFSAWIEGVFRDRPLAKHLRGVEQRIDNDGPRDVADAVAQAIRARYALTDVSVSDGHRRQLAESITAKPPGA